MTIPKNIIFIFIILISVFTYLCSLFFVEKNYFLSFLTFIYFSTIPGYVFLLPLKIKHLDFWSNLVLSVGFSLSIFLLPGLLYNWAWFQFAKTAPLEKNLLLIFNGIIFLILLIVAYFRNNKLEYTFKLSKKLLLHSLYFNIPPILTLTTILGAYQLNNSNNNFLALFSISSIVLVMLLSITFYKRISDNFFPWQVYWYSLSLLLSLSLRSLYVSGWDIQSEFKMFQVTNNFGVWSPANWDHAYNACLSITLLPAIFSKLTNFSDEFIFKFLFQILFAITPVILYLTFRKYVSSIIAFLAVTYIISQPLFIQPLTALIRQEIAYIFFVLMIFVLFKSQLSTKLQAILFLIFGFSMVVSHYSTTYISLIILILAYPILGIYRLTEKIPFISKIYNKLKISSTIKFYRYYLNPLLILLLVIFTLFWYGYVNNQLGQIQRVATEGIERMNELFKSDITSEESKKALTFLNKDLTTNDEIKNYIKDVLLKVDGDSYRLYDPKSYHGKESYPTSSSSIAPIIYTEYNRYIIISLEILKQIFKLAVIIGPVYLFFWYFKKTTFPREYIILSLVGVLIIAIMTFHPSLGLQYNLSRFYLQLLFYLTLPAIIFILFLFYPLQKFAIYVVGLLTVLLFIYLVGLPYQFIGGEARMNFNNLGSDYDKFYVHKQELLSSIWLREYVRKGYTLFADQEANLRISRVIDRSLNYNVLPPLIYKDAYVYGSYANVVNNRTNIYINGKELVITFPKAFLEENKNVIYNNGGSKIYR